MAHYVTSLIIPQPIEETFAFISDFRNAPRWDPQTLEAYKVTDGPVGHGTSFLLVGTFLMNKLILPYEIVGYDPPRELTLFGQTNTLTYRDRIEFAPTGKQTQLTYNAQLDFKSILKLANPVLQLVFQRIGDRATRGMPRAVAEGTTAVS
ncbi:MAG: SRPBCC family protein [Proteobacteria bacterium]|nr:SRPBCC family protein [Pseudomonadota bacterium]